MYVIIFKDLESEIEVLFPKPKPPSPEVTQDSITTEGSGDSEKKEGTNNSFLLLHKPYFQYSSSYCRILYPAATNSFFRLLF